MSDSRVSFLKDSGSEQCLSKGASVDRYLCCNTRPEDARFGKVTKELDRRVSMKRGVWWTRRSVHLGPEQRELSDKGENLNVQIRKKTASRGLVDNRCGRSGLSPARPRASPVEQL